MEDIRRQDQKLFLSEMLSPLRILASLGMIIAWVYILPTIFLFGTWSNYQRFGPVTFLGIAGIIAWHVWRSHRDSVEKHFHHRRFRATWEQVKERLGLFEDVLEKMRNEQVADLQDMPKNIRHVANSVYFALRRADIVSHEVLKTERGLYRDAHLPMPPPEDDQAKELFRLADRNIAEYKQQFNGVMGGVQRTEAQAAVFITTIDNLRMKMIGYRLVGKTPSLSSQELVESLAEAKNQLLAIDHALEELDLSPVALMPGQPDPILSSNEPPPLPDDAIQAIQGRTE